MSCADRSSFFSARRRAVVALSLRVDRAPFRRAHATRRGGRRAGRACGTPNQPRTTARHQQWPLGESRRYPKLRREHPELREFACGNFPNRSESPESRSTLSSQNSGQKRGICASDNSAGWHLATNSFFTNICAFAKRYRHILFVRKNISIRHRKHVCYNDASPHMAPKINSGQKQRVCR